MKPIIDSVTVSVYYKNELFIEADYQSCTEIKAFDKMMLEFIAISRCIKHTNKEFQDFTVKFSETKAERAAAELKQMLKLEK